MRSPDSGRPLGLITVYSSPWDPFALSTWHTLPPVPPGCRPARATLAPAPGRLWLVFPPAPRYPWSPSVPEDSATGYRARSVRHLALLSPSGSRVLPAAAPHTDRATIPQRVQTPVAGGLRHP